LVDLSVFVTLLYGGTVAIALPGQKGVSWQMHLFGLIFGALSTIPVIKLDKWMKKNSWQVEEDSEEEEEDSEESLEGEVEMNSYDGYLR